MVGVGGKVRVREYDPVKDAAAVEDMERHCDVPGGGDGNREDGHGGMQLRDQKGERMTNGSMKKTEKKKKETAVSISVDHMGDPISRVRHFPQHLMLVAEYGVDDDEDGGKVARKKKKKKEMVGVIRCCLKNVSMGRKQQPNYTKVAYILGLRVSPAHRRLGIATKLVDKAEEWSRSLGASYAYMATDRSNSACLALFTGKLRYVPFRTPRVLIHPVHAHRKPIPSGAVVIRVPPHVAAELYRRVLPASAAEFVPDDLEDVLHGPLTLGTFLAVPRAEASGFCLRLEAMEAAELAGSSTALITLPSSFAIMSLWDSKEVYRVSIRTGISTPAKVAASVARAMDARMPWLRIPSVMPDIIGAGGGLGGWSWSAKTNPTTPAGSVGFYFMYGLHMQGEGGPLLMRALCKVAHNMARDDPSGCAAAVVAEVGGDDPVAAGVPHWRRFSWDEDVWCMKRLMPEDADEDDWLTSKPSTHIVFVDPREV